jgi:hypothetical protein
LHLRSRAIRLGTRGQGLATGKDPPFALLPSSLPVIGIFRHPTGDAEEPVRERRLKFQTLCTAGQNEKDRLKRIFGQLIVRNGSATDPPHQRTVPLDQFRERLLIASAGEAG